MDINGVIEQYGYAALVVGSVAEGETITLLGGVAAHQGLLKFPLVVAAVALGGMIGDCTATSKNCACPVRISVTNISRWKATRT